MEQNKFRLFVVPEESGQIVLGEADLTPIGVTDEAGLKEVFGSSAYMVTVEVHRPDMRKLQQIRAAATILDAQTGFRIDDSLIPQKRAGVLLKSWSGVPSDPEPTEEGFLSLDPVLGTAIDAMLAARLMPLMAVSPNFMQAWRNRLESFEKAKASTPNTPTTESANTSTG